MAVTVPILREHIETDLSDTALQRYLDDAIAEVESRFGTDANVTEIIDPTPGKFMLPLRRKATTVISVTERYGKDSTKLIDPTEYRTRFGGRMLEKTDGTRWLYEAEVVYTPKPEEPMRDRLTIGLVQIDLTYEGLIKSDTVGDFGQTLQNDPQAYRRERENLLMQGQHRRGTLRFS